MFSLWYNSLKCSNNLKCFQFSLHCKSLSKVTQTNDKELSSKAFLNKIYSMKQKPGVERNHNLVYSEILWSKINIKYFLFCLDIVILSCYSMFIVREKYVILAQWSTKWMGLTKVWVFCCTNIMDGRDTIYNCSAQKHTFTDFNLWLSIMFI